MLVNKLLTFVCVLAVGSAVSGEFEGDSCQLSRTREKGKCTHIRRCPHALPKLRKKISPQICGFVGKEPIICCAYRSENIVASLGLIGQKKCKEYTNYIHDDKPEYIMAVFGGIIAIAKEFPHMALLGFGNPENIEWKCGGTLISEDFILTAAHCLASHELGPVKYIRLGDLDIYSNKDDAQPQNFLVEKIYRHPNYKPPSHYNDIALIQLNRPAEFTNYVKPACLPKSFDPPLEVLPIATGWGKLSFTGDSSEKLMKVSLSYYDVEECKEIYKTISKRRLPKGIDHYTQLCAGGFNEAKDTCQGDSGGPLQIKEPNSNLFYVVGITSFGKGCGIKNTPGVYTRVSSYLPWIEKIVWPE